MKYSLSFLATDIQQLPPRGRYGNQAVEAVSFNRSDLDTQKWENVWSNIQSACDAYGSTNVTYHFPMNDSDYVEDAFVYDKLVQAYARANELGLRGLVVHSNRIKTFQQWKNLDFAQERKRVFEKLASIDIVDTGTWVGLENMPLVGNMGFDMDPLFCFPDDFKDLPEAVGVVWDICHATSTEAYIRAHTTGDLVNDLVLRVKEVDHLNFQRIISKIRHWHFAAFTGLNDPALNKECIEGVLPSQGSLNEETYANILQSIATVSSASVLNFEVQESSYVERVCGPEAIRWALACLAE